MSENTYSLTFVKSLEEVEENNFLFPSKDIYSSVERIVKVGKLIEKIFDNFRSKRDYEISLNEYTGKANVIFILGENGEFPVRIKLTCEDRDALKKIVEHIGENYEEKYVVKY